MEVGVSVCQEKVTVTQTGAFCSSYILYMYWDNIKYFFLSANCLDLFMVKRRQKIMIIIQTFYTKFYSIRLRSRRSDAVVAICRSSCHLSFPPHFLLLSFSSPPHLLHYSSSLSSSFYPTLLFFSLSSLSSFPHLRLLLNSWADRRREKVGEGRIKEGKKRRN